ncbi:hypothetical protein [Janthinobacterium sp. B9-8]|nr:hypothetical protein [Janthinobacterium sp. B9-8]
MLLEHVWNAVSQQVVDVALGNALLLLQEEVSRSGGDLLTLAG